MGRYRIEREFEDFEVFRLDGPEGWARLRALILPPPTEEQSGAPFSLLDLLQRSGKVRTVVVENQYFDREHSRAFQRLYARSFPQHDRYTKRVHFFSTPFTKRSLDRLADPKIASAYLGYSVVRPLPGRRIGRTVVSPALVAPEGHFPVSSSSFEVNLAGSRLVATGVPYLEQDTHVAACATASMWMSTMAVRHFGLPTATTAEITELATGAPVGDRVIGGAGLRAEEMERGLRSMGYLTVSLGVADRESALKALHPYLEGGFAPILIIEFLSGGRHAVVVTGHDYNPARPSPKKSSLAWQGSALNYWRSSEWIEHLYIHDDQRGLYRKLRFVTPEESEARYGLKTPNIIEIDLTLPSFRPGDPFSECSAARLLAIIVPVPPGSSVLGIEAEEKSVRLLQILWEGVAPGEPLPEFVVRTVLTQSNVFKEECHSRGMPSLVARRYRGKALPKWLWATEICTPEEVLGGNGHTRQVRGEVILDVATAAPGHSFVAVHLTSQENGYICLMRPSDRGGAEALSNGLLYDGAHSYAAFHAGNV